MEFLKRNGYITLLNPSANIEPLQLLTKVINGQVENLNASIQDLFKPYNSPLPLVSDDIEMAEISGKEKLDLNVKADLVLLQHLWKLCSGKDEFDFLIEKNFEVNFLLEDPLKNTVNVVLLDSFLQDAQMNNHAKSIIKQAKEKELYIITETVKSRKFSIEIARSFNRNADITVQTEFLTTSGELRKKNESILTRKYEGENFMILGVKAYKIFYPKTYFFSSKKSSVSLSPQHQITVFRGEEDFPGVLLEEDLTINL